MISRFNSKLRTVYVYFLIQKNTSVLYVLLRTYGISSDKAPCFASPIRRIEHSPFFSISWLSSNHRECLYFQDINRSINKYLKNLQVIRYRVFFDLRQTSTFLFYRIKHSTVNCYCSLRKLYLSIGIFHITRNRDQYISNAAMLQFNFSFLLFAFHLHDKFLVPFLYSI